MALHPSARSGFSAAAQSYERGRPDYPADAVEWLATRLGMKPGRTVLDLGAGTGKLTRALIPTGARIMALEPVVEMSTLLRQLVPAAKVVAGTAEQTSLPDACVDAVTAGQSFHWFANQTALIEIHRVLRPTGGFGIIWNRRDLEDPLWAAIDRLIEPLRTSEPSYTNREWRSAVDGSKLFSPLEGKSFNHRQALTAADLVDRVVSVSYVAILPRAQRDGIARQVQGLAEASAPGNTPRVELAYQTEAWVTFASTG